MVEKLKKIWKNKFKILEGIRYSYFPNKYIEKIAAHRAAICETNECGFYDKLGVTEKIIVKGVPGCSECGCRILYKTHVLSAVCTLKDIGKTPLWDIEMTEKEEEIFRKKTGIKNDI